jgi:anti-sigma regulatory factor (Ser/Thr protein kinase)/ActR/RegA family two-component response regulator
MPVAESSALPAGRDARILLVGDDDALAGELAASERLRGITIERAHGDADAIRRLRTRDYDVVLTDPGTSIREDLAFAEEVTSVRHGTRIIVLAPAAPQADVIAALRAQAFACFSKPFDVDELATMVADAADIADWRTGIQVISGLPDWISLRVSSRQVTADRLVRFMTEYRSDLPEAERTDLMTAFREMLLNAMEHGAGFDPEKVIEVSAARTRRAIVFHVRDPGPGFDRADLAHAAIGHLGVGPMAHFERRAQLGLRPGGFGILLVRNLVDEVVYNERGNEVLLIKYTDR